VTSRRSPRRNPQGPRPYLPQGGVFSERRTRLCAAADRPAIRLILPHNCGALAATEDASRLPALRSKEHSTQLCPGPTAGTWWFFSPLLVAHSSPVSPPECLSTGTRPAIAPPQRQRLVIGGIKITALHHDRLFKIAHTRPQSDPARTRIRTVCLEPNVPPWTLPNPPARLPSGAD
jgi:hypothetical protein